MVGKDKFRSTIGLWIQGFLRQATSEETIEEERKVWKKTAQGTLMPATEFVARWWPRFTAQAYKLPEWQAVVECAALWPRLAEHIGKMVGSRGMSYVTFQLASMLRSFLPEPVFNNQTYSVLLPSFDESQFDELFTDFSRYIEQDVIVFEMKRILVALRADAGVLPLTLSPDMVIEVLPTSEVNEYGEMGLIQPPLMVPRNLYEWTGQPWLVMKWTRALPKEIGIASPETFDSDWEKAASEARLVQASVLGALAFTKFGAVGLGGGVMRPRDWPTAGPTSVYQSATRVEAMSPARARSMLLSNTDRGVLPDVFRALIARRSVDDGLVVAQRRLVDAMEDERDDERFLDDMIAGEAIFGDSDTKTENISSSHSGRPSCLSQRTRGEDAKSSRR